MLINIKGDRIDANNKPIMNVNHENCCCLTVKVNKMLNGKRMVNSRIKCKLHLKRGKLMNNQLI